MNLNKIKIKKFQSTIVIPYDYNYIWENIEEINEIFHIIKPSSNYSYWMLRFKTTGG